ncbi:MAG: sigma-70 family RNA polymerase sigma factor [Mucilaginibacter polytrichastri]|nr:sigma-70 family RNA polymerase sigma factor [Mucilaginibacter polytrichastri]
MDNLIVDGIRNGGAARPKHEKALYSAFYYFIKEAQKKYGLPPEEAGSVYTDTVLAVIGNIVSGRFAERSSLKTYIHQIFSNKCVDLLRKKSTNRGKMDDAVPYDSLSYELPDETRTVIEKLIRQDMMQQIGEKMKEIGEKCRELLLLFEDGYADREIAGMMQYQSAAVVKTTRLRCLERLRNLVTGNKHGHE